MKQSRNNQITRVSIVGISSNAVLAAFKVIVGLLSNSVAVLLDAINNVTTEKYTGKDIHITIDTNYAG